MRPCLNVQMTWASSQHVARIAFVQADLATLA
jgi:hypothetical protein